MGNAPVANGGALRLRQRCVYNCVGSGQSCSSKENYDNWLASELFEAVRSKDAVKIQELIHLSPSLKDRELMFPGESSAMTALALALARQDPDAIRVLLDAGVSPNLPISNQQRSMYAHRAQLAALNQGDPDLQHLVPNTHFEALCSTQHKEFFLLLLDKSANPNCGIIQVCHCGDIDMLQALLTRSAEPNTFQRESTPLLSAVKSKIQPYDKMLALLRCSADPDFIGPYGPGSQSSYPPLTLATRKRDYRMVRILLESGADVNLISGDEGLPNALFWATYWGELELIRLFITLSKHRLDLNVRKYTDETVLDVAHTSKQFAQLRKPRHIAKLPLPSRPPAVYEKIAQMLEEYRAQYPEVSSFNRVAGALTGSTTATLSEDKAESSTDPWQPEC